MFQVLKHFGQGGWAVDPYEENATAIQWTQMNGVEMVSGDMRAPGEDVRVLANCPITPKWLYAYTTGMDDYLVATNGSHVYITKLGAGTWTALTTTWNVDGLVTFTTFLGTLIVNSSTNGPWYYANNTTLTLLPGWFTGGHCLQMVAYKNFLVAVGVYDPARGAGTDPYLICWSDAAPAGSVPGAWDPLPTNLAGDTLAQDTSGAISGAAVMRDDLVIYKVDGQVYRLTYVGGTLVMNLQRLIQGFGVPYPGAIAELSGIHYLTTRSGLIAFDGQTMHQIDFARVQERVRETFQSADGEVTFAAAYPGLKQIWTCYRGSNDASYYGIIKYDIDQNCFTQHVYSGDNLTAICPGRIGTTYTGVEDNWGTTPSLYWGEANPDSATDPWNTGTLIPLADTMFMAFGATPGTNVIARYDPRGLPLHHDGTTKQCRVTRYGIRLGDNSNRVLVRGLYPMVKGPGSLKITLGKSWEPWQHQSTTEVQWGQEWVFIPGTTRFLPMRMVGDLFALTIISNDGQEWTLGGIGVEFEPLGLRG
jgi:hypothetical protein